MGELEKIRLLAVDQHQDHFEIRVALVHPRSGGTWEANLLLPRDLDRTELAQYLYNLADAVAEGQTGVLRTMNQLQLRLEAEEQAGRGR